MATPRHSSHSLIFTVRLFAEITVKSASVRKRWTKLLAQNLRALGRQIEVRTSVVQEWDRLELRVYSPQAESRAAFIDLLMRTPGIANFSEIKVYPLKDMHDIFEKTLPEWSESLVSKTFCVRVRRTGCHEFSSSDVERYVGGELNQHISTAGVQLKNPDATVRIEIKDDNFFVVTEKHTGLGGFPLGTQDPVMSLVSGGFDSTVASYQMIKRGVRTHFCFFNLGGRSHEASVKEIAYFLWRKYGSSHRVRFITVPFDEVVSEILQKISAANMGVVLKRMMLRAAEQIAARGGIQALVTGEAISQVSSQTIPNLSAIDSVTSMLVLRPLIAVDKPDIIRSARQIGVEDFSSNIPEYCGVISIKPSASVDMCALREEEAKFNFDIIGEAVGRAVQRPIDKVISDYDSPPAVEKLVLLPARSVVIDIRHPQERGLKPLVAAEHEILEIPFYKLNKAFETLAPDQRYFLYCEKGVMSQLHAVHLKDIGFANVDVYRPEKVT